MVQDRSKHSEDYQLSTSMSFVHDRRAPSYLCGLAACCIVDFDQYKSLSCIEEDEQADANGAANQEAQDISDGVAALMVDADIAENAR